MNQPNLRQTVALFRYGLIAEFVHLPPSSPGIYAKLQQKANQTYAIPGSTRTRVAAETLRDWLKRYRRSGFDALLPQPRSDRGRSRALPPVVADRLISLKEELPQLSIPQLIRVAFERRIATEAQPLPRATVHRLFSHAGLMHKTAEPSEQDRRRFAFAHAGELWMSDVMHGPTVAIGERGQRHKAYLIAFSGRCHSGHPLRRLRPGREHQGLFADLQAGPVTPRKADAFVRRQRRQLSLPALGPGLRQARHRANPFPTP